MIRSGLMEASCLGIGGSFLFSRSGEIAASLDLWMEEIVHMHLLYNFVRLSLQDIIESCPPGEEDSGGREPGQPAAVWLDVQERQPDLLQPGRRRDDGGRAPGAAKEGAKVRDWHLNESMNRFTISKFAGSSSRTLVSRRTLGRTSCRRTLCSRR